MKKFVIAVIFVLIMIFYINFGGMSISNSRYKKISNLVLENRDDFSIENEIEFFDYKTRGLSIGGIYYGHYYTSNNEIVVPDFYGENNLGEPYEADGGTYFGRPNNG